MKLFRTEASQDALVQLLAALTAEATAAGETIKTLVVTGFTEEDDEVNNTSVAGCDCEVCLERARRSVLAIIDGRAQSDGRITVAVH